MHGLFLRKAVADDCRDLWEWRNHEDIRKWSFNKSPIPFEEHKKWFEQRLNDSNYVILVACDGKSNKLGQIRFDVDRKKNTAHVNVHLNPQYFNQGLGTRIIIMGTNLIHAQYPLMKICAEILLNNIVSQKAFTKAGYSLLDNACNGKDDKQTYYFNV